MYRLRIYDIKFVKIFLDISNSAKDSYYCDRGLIQSLVYDAKVTEWFPKDSTFGSNEKE
jgi:hypothetical protein